MRRNSLIIAELALAGSNHPFRRPGHQREF
jgi:hypothetical protein